MNDDPGIVVVGGGPAGLRVAKTYRECGGAENITIVSADAYLPYNRPPLTKEFLRGEMPTSELPLEDSAWYLENEVGVMLETRATSLDTRNSCVTLSSGEVLPYSGCVMATGSRPVRPQIPGADDPNICFVRTLEDAERLVSLADTVGESGRIAVIGSGFIGCEAAASLAMLGAEVIMLTIEESPQLERLGTEAASAIRNLLFDLGIESRFGTEVRRIERNGTSFVVVAGESIIPADGVLIGAGMLPNTDLAEQAGLDIEGGIVCDSSMRASGSNIYAVGDVAFARNETVGRRLRVEHWGDALGQGKVCGEVLAGRESIWRDVPGFWSTIGGETFKYAAWGDGWDESRFVENGDGFTIWYGLEGVCVGVLTCRCDEDYERGRELVSSGAALPS